MQDLFDGHGWRITLETVDLLNGGTKEYARVHRNDSVHLLVVPAPGKVLLLREYRPVLKQWRWMIPAGKMDKGNETPLEAARRELREETGFRAGDLQPYCVCRPSENVVQQNHVFLAKDLTPDPLPQEHYETIEVHELSLDDAIDRVLAQDPLHTLSGFVLLHYARAHS